MKIEKPPSGSYRIRKMYKDRSYSITTDYKPTQKEAIQLMAQELDKQPASKFHMTFEEAPVRYVDIKKNVLSPGTVKDYMEYAELNISAFISSVIILPAKCLLSAYQRLI